MIGNNDLWIAAPAAHAAGLFWSPTTNASFGALRAWKFRIGPADPSHRAQPQDKQRGLIAGVSPGWFELGTI